MRTLSKRWWRYWFEPTAPTNLGFCRMLFVGLLLLRYRVVPIDPTDAPAWAEVPRVFWMPYPILNHFVPPVFSGEVLALLEFVWTVALACGCIGLWTRFSTTASFVLGTYLLWLPHNFGKLHHMDGLAILVLGILALSRCGDAWSLDRLIGRARHARQASAAVPANGDYTWPIRVVWLLMVIVLLQAGVSKLRNGGLDWITSDSLSIMFIKANYNAYTGIAPLTSWGLYVAHYGWLSRLVAAATVLLEVGYPVALVSRRARMMWVPAALVMVIGMFCMVVPAFIELIGCHVFWVPWDRVGRRLCARRHGRAAAAATPL